jgi:hypothetical protein
VDQELGEGAGSRGAAAGWTARARGPVLTERGRFVALSLAIRTRLSERLDRIVVAVLTIVVFVSSRRRDGDEDLYGRMAIDRKVS